MLEIASAAAGFGLRLGLPGRGLRPITPPPDRRRTTRNRLKSPELDEGIQENPSPFSGLVWLGFGLEEFGPRRSTDGRRPVAPRAPFHPNGQSLSPGTERRPVALDCRRKVLKVEFAPGNGMASDASDPQYPAPGGSGPDRETDPAAAGGDRVRVLDLERLAHQVVDEVELGALQHFERDRVDDAPSPRRGWRRSRPRRGSCRCRRRTGSPSSRRP